MASNDDPNAGQAAIPDNTRDPSASPLPLPPNSALSPALTDTGSTPGLQPGDELHAALRQRLTPDVERFDVQPNLQGGPERMAGYAIPADGKKENMSPARWGSVGWNQNATEEEN
jgi:hypothetical protein